MIESRGGRIQELFREAVKLPRAERRSFLDSRSGGDVGLRAIVEALVEAHEESQTAGVGATAQGSNGHADPERVGPYRIAQKIGEGGMGTVYVAEQTEPIRRTVALKVIKRGMDTDEVLARFEHERQSLALMNHAGIAQVHDAGATADGRPYFVMEHVPGLAITEYCDQNQLTVSERIELFLDVCAAVQHAHQKGIIHRDLKPSNILVTLHDGLPLPKIIDFGLAKSIETRLTERTVATRLGQIMGTPGYMSPEQMDIAAPDVDTRSDVYALGVILYEILVGVLPFDPESLHAAGYVEVQRIIRTVEPPRPSTRFSRLNGASEVAARARGTDPRTLARHLRGDLDWIVMRCLEKDRARRYASASELTADLERHLDHEPVLAGPPSRAYRLRKFVRKNRGLVAATTLVFAALTTGLAVASYGLVEANRHRDIAEGALRDTRIARDAEKERATQLQQVADFQGEQLSGIDAALMGIRLRNGLLDAVRAASERGRHTEEETTARVTSVEALIANANFTDLARNALDENIFERTSQTIDTQFEEQPVVRAQLIQTLADTMRELGLFDQAVRLQEKTIAIRREALGSDDQGTLSSITTMGILLTLVGRLSDATPYCQEALATTRRVFGNEHRHTVRANQAMGLLLQRQGNLAEAEVHYRDGLEASRRVLGNEHVQTLALIGHLGELILDRGRVAEAEPYYRERWKTSRRVLGPDSRQAIGATNSLGNLLSSLGREAEAESYYRQALEASRRVIGSEHQATVSVISNLAISLSDQGKLAEAEPYHHEALETNRRVYGHEHPDTLITVSRMADFLSAQGKDSEAEPYYREALGARRRVLGDQHPDTLSSINSLANCLTRLGKYPEAEACYRELLDVVPRVLGDEHPHTLRTMHNLGVLLFYEHKLPDARRCFEQALEATRRVCGEEHPDTLDCMSGLATTLIEMDKLPEAESLLRQALEISRRVQGDDHPDTVLMIVKLGRCLQRERATAESESLLREGLRSCQRLFGDGHRHTLTAMLDLSELLRHSGRSEEAEALCAEGVRAARESLSPGHWNIGSLLVGHGKALAAMQRYENAAQDFQEAHGILAASLGPSDARTMETIQELISCYEAWHAAEPGAGHDAKAAEWRAKLPPEEAKPESAAPAK